MSNPLDRVPGVRPRRYNQRLTIPISDEMRDELCFMKLVHKKNVLEWVRELIARELAQIRLNEVGNAESGVLHLSPKRVRSRSSRRA